MAALDTVGVMRLGLLPVAIGAVLVTAAELTFLAHWGGTLQLVLASVGVSMHVRAAQAAEAGAAWSNADEGSSRSLV
jgi:hypothetical protein